MLYAHYGQTRDFKSLRDLNISSDGKIVLIRAGKISFAEKVGTILHPNSFYIFILTLILFTFLLSLNLQVANAASVNASAVLIYPDPTDYSFDEETNLFGHVCTGLKVHLLFTHIHVPLRDTHTRRKKRGKQDTMSNSTLI